MGYRINANAESAIRSFIVGVLAEKNANFKCIWGRGKHAEVPADRPAKPYAVLTIINPPLPDSSKSFKKWKARDVWTWEKSYRFTVQCDIIMDGYSSGTVTNELDMDIAAYIALRSNSTNTKDILDPKGIKLIAVSNFQDTTELISNGYESRTTFEMEFAWKLTYDETIGQIETISSSGTFTYEGL